jgi:adenosylcobyric acid synthase
MAKAIMVQGTASNAGKSVITAALCRIFMQDGYRVAPFKSQNMALNSFITADGLEMGRAQVMQAEAAGLAPDVRMNPILLKPSSDVGSQVIVGGRPLETVQFGNMSAREYYAHKAKLRGYVESAYASLAADYDVIVIEGAGSPAEINLNKGDFVNMGMADIADAPVLLAGDIDRGGVLASMYGTVKLLPPEHQARIKGLIINKFRGDVDILRPGLVSLEEMLRIPVVGVIPYARFDVDDEDSVSARLESAANARESERYTTRHCEERSDEAIQSKGANPDTGLPRRFAPRNDDMAEIDIAVIMLPHISNFTDFNVFERIPGVSVRYVDSPRKFGCPDMVLIPGSKNTMGDLLALRDNGMEELVQRFAMAGGPVFGICGGYQMMGDLISDPMKTEHGGEIPGMGLLQARTVFAASKTTVQVSGQVAELGRGTLFSPLRGLSVQGYEIHMGDTESDSPLAMTERGPDGSYTKNCAGTYIHGFFDNPEICLAMTNILRKRKALPPLNIKIESTETYKQKEYDKLAEVVRNALDMDFITSLLSSTK